jgi:NaMN:DMB phosphoribosyltransferase
MNLLEQTIGAIRPIDAEWIAAAERRQIELTKPPGSLGRLEEIANRWADHLWRSLNMEMIRGWTKRKPL